MTTLPPLKFRLSEWSAVVCPGCGVEFIVRKTLLDSREESGTPFYCPNGHWTRVVEGGEVETGS